jgi:hypothetical protein
MGATYVVVSWAVDHVVEISAEVVHRVWGDDADIPGLDVVLHSVELSEIKSAHWVKLLVGAARSDSEWFLDETQSAFLRKDVRSATSHVDDGMLSDVFAGQARLGESLAIVRVDWTG